MAEIVLLDCLRRIRNEGHEILCVVEFLVPDARFYNLENYEHGEVFDQDNLPDRYRMHPVFIERRRFVIYYLVD